MISPFPHYLMAELPDLPDKWVTTRANLDVGIRPIVPSLMAAASLNAYVNAHVVYRGELPGEDDWQLPEHTWWLRSGDCEDHAILKYAVLLKSGVAETDLLLTLGLIIINTVSSPHACLLARFGRWYVLDSNFDQLILPENYKTFAPIKAFTGSHAFLFSYEFIINEINGETARKARKE